jgi:Arc/MetJ family transcription regulator
MRTNIEIDDKLMAQAIRLTGLPTKRAVVEEGLRLLVQVRKQAQAPKALRDWAGKATSTGCAKIALRAPPHDPRR